MKGSRRGLSVEIGFVLAMVLILKEWVFPYFIWRFFPTGDMAAKMGEWMVIIVGVILCVIYLGLGSTSRQIYQLSLTQALQVFALIHLPLWLIGGLPLTLMKPLTWIQEAGKAWSRLIGDGLRLFDPSLSIDLMFLSAWVALCLFLCGRNLRVSEEASGRIDNQVGKRSAMNKRD
ncbi:hypothetical protein [Marininema halotolerans]|uniref:Uncharacterized protein n=1 Tax=Marininema halotolerans TaxID=1155944 RepID=A0A1I6U026_9BACL|nr:hypothetical protein [Marininema halotolerans]SFS94637.1 hypothetical protein SAMN05444972_11253 [Marininema halotolerans]